MHVLQITAVNNLATCMHLQEYEQVKASPLPSLTRAQAKDCRSIKKRIFNPKKNKVQHKETETSNMSVVYRNLDCQHLFWQLDQYVIHHVRHDLSHFTLGQNANAHLGLISDKPGKTKQIKTKKTKKQSVTYKLCKSGNSESGLLIYST